MGGTYKYEIGGHCLRGHLLTEETLRHHAGQGSCQVCESERRRARSARVRENRWPPDCKILPGDGPLRVLRKSQMVTLTELARRTGIKDVQLWDMECNLGRRLVYPAGMENLRRLASVLGEGVWAAYGFETVGVLMRRLREHDPAQRRDYELATALANLSRARRVVREYEEQIEVLRGGVELAVAGGAA